PVPSSPWCPSRASTPTPSPCTPAPRPVRPTTPCSPTPPTRWSTARSPGTCTPRGPPSRWSSPRPRSRSSAWRPTTRCPPPPSSSCRCPTGWSATRAVSSAPATTPPPSATPWSSPATPPSPSSAWTWVRTSCASRPRPSASGRSCPSRFPEGMDAAQTAMSSIGQFDVRVTPLQMAMVSQAIANGGRQMQPYLVATERNADLEVVATTEPTELRRSISPRTAEVLTDLMTSVVENGTGRHAQLPGIAVAGKTGTAQSGTDAPPHAWFTSFAPADDPRVAVAVVVEHGGVEGDVASGGTTAAPIAREVLAALLQE